MKNIGIVGGGQLGRMLTQAAHPLGFYVSVLDPTPNGPAGLVADKQIVADFKDEASIEKLASTVDFLTFEIELAAAGVLDKLQKNGVLVNPTGETLSIIKDKLRQKDFLRKNDIPVADFMEVSSHEDIEHAAKIFKYPLVLKARFDAYDGRGNALIETRNDIDDALEKLSGRKLYVEKFISFQKELAVVAARGMDGAVVAYPTVETIHKNNICHIVVAPAPIDSEVSQVAHKLAEKVLTHLYGAGVFGIEMFLTNNGEILINEIAPRVHNSGHHTIESSYTSQFEQHIRAITGMPLGDANLKVKHAVMINILGNRTGPANPIGVNEASSLRGVAVHMYDKIETRPERKMGHITAVAETAHDAMELAKRAREMITI